MKKPRRPVKARRGTPKSTPKGEGSPRLNQAALAVFLKRDRRTVAKYLSIPGAPRPDERKRYDAEEAARWIEKQAPRASEDDGEIKRMRQQLLRMEVEEKELALAERRCRLVDKKTIEPTIARFLGQLTEDLRSKFEFELPPKYEGADRIARAKLNAEAIDWALRRAKDGASPITR